MSFYSYHNSFYINTAWIFWMFFCNTGLTHNWRLIGNHYERGACNIRTGHQEIFLHLGPAASVPQHQICSQVLSIVSPLVCNTFECISRRLQKSYGCHHQGIWPGTQGLRAARQSSNIAVLNKIFELPGKDHELHCLIRSLWLIKYVWLLYSIIKQTSLHWFYRGYGFIKSHFQWKLISREAIQRILNIIPALNGCFYWWMLWRVKLYHFQVISYQVKPFIR